MPKEGITTSLVFVECTLTTGFPTMTFFPVLETVPLVDKETWARRCPPVVEGIGELEINGIFQAGGAGMEG